MKKFLVVFFLFLICPFLGNAQSRSMSKAYEALRIYNYFEAKRLFEKKIKKEPVLASYGLSVIYLRTDNPFHQLDSAYKYILLAESNYPKASEKQIQAMQKLGVNQVQLLSTKMELSSQWYVTRCVPNSVASYQYFMDANPWAYEYSKAEHIRDSLAFDLVKQIDSSKYYLNYLQTYPNSYLSATAKSFYDLLYYQEKTTNDLIEEYVEYIWELPEGTYAVNAEKRIYELATVNNTLKEYEEFLTLFPNNRFGSDAWRKLYQIYMADYSVERLESFKIKYPKYPFFEELEQEQALARQAWYPFKKGNLFGFMDQEGREVVPAIYESVNFFKEGLALVMSRNKYGYIDKNKSVIIPFVYDSGTDFENGRAIVEQDGKYGLIDRNGTLIVNVEMEDLGALSNNRFFAKKDSLYGYYSKNGDLAIPFQYQEAFSFGQLAIVSKQDYFGAIDTSGNIKVPFDYEGLTNFSNNLFIFEKEGVYGLVSSSNEWVVPPKYDYIGSLHSNRAIVILNDKLGYIDETGYEIIACKYEKFANYPLNGRFYELYAKVKFKDKYGIIDLNGKLIVPTTYADLGRPITPVSFNKGKLWGYINLQNKVVQKPLYEYAESFINQTAIVSSAGKYGLVNLKNEKIIPLEYDNVLRIDTDYFQVEKDGKFGVFSRDGFVLAELKYQQIQMLDKDLVILYAEDSVEYLYLEERKWVKLKNE